MFRRTAPSRSSTTVAAHRGRSERAQVSWSSAEAADMIAAPGVAVGASAHRGARTENGSASERTVTTADRRAEDDAVSVRLDLAWQRLVEARAATEGRPGGIGDDVARRDPVTRPFPIAFGTPARTNRSATGTAMLPAVPTGATPTVPAASVAPRPVRRNQAAIAMHRPQGMVPRARAPRRLTADRWSTAVG